MAFLPYAADRSPLTVSRRRSCAYVASAATTSSSRTLPSGEVIFASTPLYWVTCVMPGVFSSAFCACGTIGWPLADWTMKSAPTDLSSSSVAEATIEEPTTDRQATRARPIIRAAPVAPVRRGLRSALRSAIRPTGPNIRSTSALMTRTTTPASSGPMTTKPMRERTTPRPRNIEPSLALSACVATSRAAAPPPVRSSPIPARTQPALPSAGVPASRRAAIGEIFPARRAGM